MFAENITDTWDHEERYRGFLCQDICNLFREVFCKKLFWCLIHITIFYPWMR